MNAKKLRKQYLAKRDYDRNNLNQMETICSRLEGLRNELIEIRQRDNTNNETVRAIGDIESALRYLDHYLNRREAAGIYTLEIGENSGHEVDEIATRTGFGNLDLIYTTDSPDGAQMITLPFAHGRIVDLKYIFAFLAEYYNYHNTPLILWNPKVIQEDPSQPSTMTVNIAHHPDQVLTPEQYNEYLSNKYELFVESLYWDMNEEERKESNTHLYKAFIVRSVNKPGDEVVVPFEGWVKDFMDKPNVDSPEGYKQRVRFSHLSLAVSRLIAETLGIEQYQICGDQRIPALYGVFVELTDEIKTRLEKEIKDLIPLYESMETY